MSTLARLVLLVLVLLLAACGAEEIEIDERTTLEEIHADRGMEGIPTEFQTAETAERYVLAYGMEDAQAIQHVEPWSTRRLADTAFVLNKRAAQHIKAEFLTPSMADWLAESGGPPEESNFGGLWYRQDLWTEPRILAVLTRDPRNLLFVPRDKITPKTVEAVITTGEFGILGEMGSLPWNRELVQLAWARDPGLAYSAIPDDWKTLRMSEELVQKDPEWLCRAPWEHRVANGGRLSRLALELTDASNDDDVAGCVPARFKSWEFASAE